MTSPRYAGLQVAASPRDRSPSADSSSEHPRRTSTAVNTPLPSSPRPGWPVLQQEISSSAYSSVHQHHHHGTADEAGPSQARRKVWHRPQRLPHVIFRPSPAVRGWRRVARGRLGGGPRWRCCRAQCPEPFGLGAQRIPQGGWEAALARPDSPQLGRGASACPPPPG